MNTKNGSQWDRKEVTQLRRLFGSRSNATVADMLQRTPKAVERKASKLGLSKSKKYLRSLGRKV